MKRPLFTTADIPLQSTWQSAKGKLMVIDNVVNWLNNKPTDIITWVALQNTGTGNYSWIHIDKFNEMLKNKIVYK